MMCLPKIIFWISLLCSLSTRILAQEFEVKATLDKVTKTGFYEIPLDPELTAYTKVDLSDLRIWDQHNNQVPYLVRPTYDLNKENKIKIYELNPQGTFTQKDSNNKNSYLYIRYKYPIIIDSISLKVSGPKFYKRKAKIYNINNKGFKELVSTFELTSGQKSGVIIYTTKTKTLLIEINNEDNPPLIVQTINTGQIARNLVAYLEIGRSYTILAGNKEMKAPQYDLSMFNDSIPALLPVITYRKILPTGTDYNKNRNFDTKNWLWLAIIISVIALAFLTYKLLSDIKQKGI